MRTNIVLDDDLLDEAMKYAHSRSKRGVVHEALATYVAVKADEERRANYQARLADIRIRLAKGKRRPSAHRIIREDRNRGS